jgi:hypothetical protein
MTGRGILQLVFRVVLNLVENAKIAREDYPQG